MNLVNENKHVFIDVDRFSDEVADILQDMGATISKKKESIFSKIPKRTMRNKKND